MLVRIQGIVLKTYSKGEDDRLLLILTPQLGFLRVLAPRAERPGHALSAATQVLAKSDFILYRPAAGIAVIRQASLLDAYADLRSHVERLSYALAMLELFSRISEAVQDCAREEFVLVQLYKDMIASLERLRTADAPLFALAHLAILTLPWLGLSLSYTTCAACFSSLPHETSVFSFLHGGFLCPSCQREEKNQGALMLHPRVRLLMQKMSQAHVDQLREVRVEVNLQKQIYVAIALFLREYAGIVLRSFEVIQQLQE